MLLYRIGAYLDVAYATVNRGETAVQRLAGQGGDLGGMHSLYIGLGSLDPTAAGFVAGRASYTVAFAGCLVVAVVLILTGE